MARQHPRSHRLADIAEQSGLSKATIDRVLHGRAGVSARAVRAVEQAIFDLDRQQSQLRLAARTLVLDVIVKAPERFSAAVRAALEDELPAQRPAAVRARFVLRENADVAAAVAALDAIGSRGRLSHGVLLKAPDDPAVAAAIDRLTDRGEPVITLVTDVPGSRRAAYVGPDNTAAGATAAYLVEQALGRREGEVLLTLSRSLFSGERERAGALTAALARSQVSRTVHTVTDTDGLDATLRTRVAEVLEAHPGVAAVYSVGGGNTATAEAFASAGLTPAVFIAHDLDHDNLRLLRDGALTAVLHLDLQADMRHAVRQVLRAHRLVRGAPTSVSANVEIITPHNIPPRLPRW